MHTIIPFSDLYRADLVRFAQELRNFLSGLDGRLDEPLVYDTRKEVEQSIQEYHEGKNMIFLSVEDGTAYGYILVTIKEEDWEGTALKKYAKIEELYIDPHFRGKGASKALILAAERYFMEKGIRYIELSVMAGNHRARAFYEKMGLIEHKITLAKRL